MKSSTGRDLTSYSPTGYKMINEISISNFRCFKHLNIKNCSRFNIIVGENGSGKTALMEAIFLVLSGNIEVSIRMKNQRGLSVSFAGNINSIEESIWKDYFYNLEWPNKISISLQGTGEESRSLTIESKTSSIVVSYPNFDQGDFRSISSPLIFKWTNSNGTNFEFSPQITSQGIQVPLSTENLPNYFFFAANQPVGTNETAERFSQLSRENKADKFVKVLTKEYPWIENMSIEVVGGIPSLHASVKGSNVKLPVNLISGSINRVISIMLAIASHPKGVVLVDEIENGVYYKHKAGLWRTIIKLAYDNECQLFLTTHDEELLDSFTDETDSKLKDISLWRMERTESSKRVLKQFSGITIKKALNMGGEVR